MLTESGLQCIVLLVLLRHLKCGAFRSWYALTGCDTVSSFHGGFSTEVFLALSNPVHGVLSDNSIPGWIKYLPIGFDTLCFVRLV